MARGNGIMKKGREPAIESRGVKPTTPRPSPLGIGKAIRGEKPATPRPEPSTKPSSAEGNGK